MSILEKLAKEIYDECKREGDPISMKDALEMAEMEIKSKTISASEREKSEETEKKPRKPRIRKVDKTKGRLLEDIRQLLEGLGADNTSIVNEVELLFDFEDSNYSIRLIKHRKKKGA